MESDKVGATWLKTNPEKCVHNCSILRIHESYMCSDYIKDWKNSRCHLELPRRTNKPPNSTEKDRKKQLRVLAKAD